MTDNAGYCMAVTAKRDNMRLLAIVLGEESGKIRNQETSELLDYGFNLYEIMTIKNKGDILGNLEIDKSNQKDIKIVADSDVTVLKKKNEVEVEYKSEIKLNNIKLPIKKGDEVGKLIIKDSNGNKIDDVVITVSSDVLKENIFKLYLKILKGIILGDLV